MKNEQCIMNYKVKIRMMATLLALACGTPVSGQYYVADAGGSGKEKVAVYVTGQVPEMNKIVGNRLVSTIVKQGKYTAVERSAEFLTQLLSEHEYECSGQVCVEQISRVGKQFGVDKICAAEITSIEGRYYITVRLIDVVTAEILDTEEASSRGNLDNLIATTNRLAAALFDILYVKKQKGTYLSGEALYLSQYGWGGTAAIGYRFNEYVALGAGGGYAGYAGENFSGSAIPLFADLRVNILPFMVAPYVAVAAGVCFDTYTNTDTFVDKGKTVTKTNEYKSTYGYYNVAAGLYLRCSDSFAVHAGAGYNNIVKTYSINAGIAITFN
jgi:hypothetical protein